MSFALLYFTVSTLFTPRHACLKELRANHIRLATVESINRDLESLRAAPLLERITRWSERFLGTPYGIDPAGEGEGRDQDPLFNTCAVDCETFVEQVLALSFSKNVAETWRWLERMRYRGGERLYDNRYYTMALQWIPGNLSLGYMVLAHQKMGLPTVKIRKEINPEYNWARIFRRRFQELGKNAPRGRAELQYIPLKLLRKNIHKIPIPAMGLVVGARQIKNPFLITHMGFILRNTKGQVIWRHASGSPGRERVEDRLLANYLHALSSYFTKHRRRHVMGMVIYSLVDPPRKVDQSR